MEVKTLFNNETINKDLRRGWGLSFLIDQKILFDTGENGFWLLENMRNLNVDIERIKTVVISHDHWDHTGGLWEVLKNRKSDHRVCTPRDHKDCKKGKKGFWPWKDSPCFWRIPLDR